MLLPCDGKTALVTEGSHGIGRGASLALGCAGAQVLIQHDGAPVHAAKVVSEIRAKGSKAEAVSASLTTAHGPHELARKTRAIMGDRLDVLVVNCGSSEGLAHKIAAAETFETHIAHDIRAPLVLVQEFLPILAPGSSIVFTMRRLDDDEANYARVATRGAISALVPYLASKLAERGVRANAVTYGSAFLPTQANKGAASRQHSAAQCAYASIASVITFLASERARCISGETLSDRLTTSAIHEGAASRT